MALMLSYERQQEAVTGIARVFDWPGRILGFLGMWLLASVASWLIGALPAWLLLPLVWLGWLSSHDKGGKVAVVFTAATLAAGLILLGLFSLSDAERHIRRERRAGHEP